MPLSRLFEMAEVAIAKIAPELEGSQKEPPQPAHLSQSVRPHGLRRSTVSSTENVARDVQSRCRPKRGCSGIAPSGDSPVAECVTARHTLEHTSTLRLAPGMLYW